MALLGSPLITVGEGVLRAMEAEATKQKAMQLMSEAIAGRRGPVTDEDLGL